tara:strand:+ start:1984 stop:2736 length:753 start_codon:yes stop_codon:yes gene_type:complete
MKAIILAAGLGSRLGKFGENIPKGLIIINGKTLIQRQIEIFHNCGINDITVITGHNNELINYPDITYIKNKNYANTNMNESFFCAREKFNDSVIVSYSDIVYDQKIIEQILKFDHDFSVGVRLDWKSSYENRTQHPLSEAENVLIENSKIINIGKNISFCSKNQEIGEFLGIIKFSKKGITELLETYLELKKNHKGKFHNSNSLQEAYLTDMLHEIIDSGKVLHPVLLNNFWFEIDTVEDLERAKNSLKT